MASFRADAAREEVSWPGILGGKVAAADTRVGSGRHMQWQRHSQLPVAVVFVIRCTFRRASTGFPNRAQNLDLAWHRGTQLRSAHEMIATVCVGHKTNQEAVLATEIDYAVPRHCTMPCGIERIKQHSTYIYIYIHTERERERYIDR